jgi:hypothetical protein
LVPILDKPWFSFDSGEASCENLIFEKGEMPSAVDLVFQKIGFAGTRERLQWMLR